MKEIDVSLQVSGQKSMTVNAYEDASVPGLAMHREVQWVPAKGEHKFTSKWTITHIASGLTLCRPSETLETLGEAKQVVKLINDFDWTREEPTTQIGIMNAFQGAIGMVRDATDREEVSEAPERSSRFVIRRNSEGPGYVVVDTSTDQVIETFMHRGMASNFAKEQNAKVSL